MSTPHNTPHRSLALAAATIAALIGLAGCSSSGPGADGGWSPGEESPAWSDGDSLAPGFIGDDMGQASTQEPGERSVIQTASLSVQVPVVSEALDDLRTLVTSSGGYVEYLNQSQSERWGESAELIVRVPAERLEDFVERSKEVGEVSNLTLGQTDVTLTVQDLDARISAAQLSIERLEALIEQAGTLQELLQAETQLTDRQSQLERYTSQRQYYAEQVDLATVTLNVSEQQRAASVDTGGFLDGLQDGWNALVASLGAALTALGFLLPWLGIAVILWIVIAVLLRRRRAKRAAAPASHTPSSAPASPSDASLN